MFLLDRLGNVTHILQFAFILQVFTPVKYERDFLYMTSVQIILKNREDSGGDKIGLVTPPLHKDILFVSGFLCSVWACLLCENIALGLICLGVYLAISVEHQERVLPPITIGPSQYMRLMFLHVIHWHNYNQTAEHKPSAEVYNRPTYISG